MQTSENPNPFPPSQGYTITVHGGTPPYDFQPPAQPPGVTITVNGNTAEVQVPPNTASGTDIEVQITDSSVPPKVATSTSRTA